MLLFSSKIINKTCTVETETDEYYGQVKAVNDDWIEIVDDGVTFIVNGRYIVSVAIDEDPTDNVKPRKRLFGKNRQGDDL